MDLRCGNHLSLAIDFFCNTKAILRLYWDCQNIHMTGRTESAWARSLLQSVVKKTLYFLWQKASVACYHTLWTKCSEPVTAYYTGFSEKCKEGGKKVKKARKISWNSKNVKYELNSVINKLNTITTQQRNLKCMKNTPALFNKTYAYKINNLLTADRKQGAEHTKVVSQMEGCIMRRSHL